MLSKFPKWRATVAGIAVAAMVATTLSTAPAQAAPKLKTGLKVFVIPKNLGNSYFTTSDSVKSGGALAALEKLGEVGQETSGPAPGTPANQLPVIQADISKGANALLISATDPTALCPTLTKAMKQGIVVVTYDSDAPTCRTLFINQASPQGIGEIEVTILAQEIDPSAPTKASGEIAIVSATASDTNQNTWIGWMKVELKNYPGLKLVSTVYGNDDPATSVSVTQGLLSSYPNLVGIISPTSVGLPAVASVLDPKYTGKIQLTGLATPNEMKKYVADGTVKAFALWNPANLGYLAAYAAVELASKAITNAAGQTFTAPPLKGTFKVGSDATVLLGPPYTFNKSNINNFNF